MFLIWAIQARKMCFRKFQKKKTADQAMKTTSSNSRKIQIFSKGVNPCFWSKIGYFSIFLFQVIQARKMCFTIFWNEKMLLQAIRTRISKSRKLESFPKGLVHGFDPKLAIFPSFHFSHQRAGKCVLRYSRRKKRLSRL